MKADFKYLQNFYHETAQRKPKSSLEETSEYHDFIFLGVGQVFSPSSALTIDKSQKYLPLILTRWLCLMLDFPKTAWLGRQGRSSESSPPLSTS
jgi:hypothetical protein